MGQSKENEEDEKLFVVIKKARLAASFCWQQVICAACGQEYECTPLEDYYEATSPTDGICAECFVEQKGIPSIEKVVVLDAVECEGFTLILL